MNKKSVRAFFTALAAEQPQPKTELRYVNPYTLLVAVILSAQATDVGVNRATEKLFASVTSPAAMLRLGLDKLKAHIKTIGLYNTKAKNILAMSKILVEEHDGEVPQTRRDLEKLPGVGRKTANVILNTAFGQPTLAVDTHVFRVANRTGLAAGKNVEEVEEKLMQVVPKDFLMNAHHWLILHGRYVCKARTPLCGQCVVRTTCEYKEKTA